MGSRSQPNVIERISLLEGGSKAFRQELKILLAEISIVCDWIKDKFGVELINKSSEIYKSMHLYDEEVEDYTKDLSSVVSLENGEDRQVQRKQSLHGARSSVQEEDDGDDDDFEVIEDGDDDGEASFHFSTGNPLGNMYAEVAEDNSEDVQEIQDDDDYITEALEFDMEEGGLVLDSDSMSAGFSGGISYGGQAGNLRQQVKPRQQSRRSYSLQEKIFIINEVDSGKRKIQVAIENGLPPRSVEKIYRNRELIRRHLNKAGCNLDKRRLVDGKYEDIEEDLFKWYTEGKNRGVLHRATAIAAKAKELAMKYGRDEFKGSLNWVDKWRKKYGLQQKQVEMVGHFS